VRVNLGGLPQFTVLEIRGRHPNGSADILGSFSHLRGVHGEDGWLYRVGGRSLVGGLNAVPCEAGVPVVFTTPDADLASELAVGTVYPWVGGYWQAYHVDLILAGAASWQHRTFTATPAHYFRQSGVTGWQPLGAALPEGAEDLGIKPAAWDHEHCELCRATIGAGGSPDGYVNPDDHWLCPTCFTRYAATGDLSFAVEV
jgi:hypothetical protein